MQQEQHNLVPPVCIAAAGHVITFFPLTISFVVDSDHESALSSFERNEDKADRD
jgi:hypothetical protein